MSHIILISFIYHIPKFLYIHLQHEHSSVQIKWHKHVQKEEIKLTLSNPLFAQDDTMNSGIMLLTSTYQSNSGNEGVN